MGFAKEAKNSHPIIDWSEIWAGDERKLDDAHRHRIRIRLVPSADKSTWDFAPQCEFTIEEAISFAKKLKREACKAALDFYEDAVAPEDPDDIEIPNAVEHPDPDSFD